MKLAQPIKLMEEIMEFLAHKVLFAQPVGDSAIADPFRITMSTTFLNMDNQQEKQQ